MTTMSELRSLSRAVEYDTTSDLYEASLPSDFDDHDQHDHSGGAVTYVYGGTIYQRHPKCPVHPWDAPVFTTLEAIRDRLTGELPECP